MKQIKPPCIFCKIISGQAKAVKIWEDRQTLAIFDINPNTKGMTLVLSKKHYDSDVFSLPKKTYCAFLSAAKSVARILEHGLKVKRVAMIAEGMGINHAHIKLYPLHGLAKKFTETWAKERIYFKRYAGYLSTQLGPPKKLSELKKLAQTIRRQSR